MGAFNDRSQRPHRQGNRSKVPADLYSGSTCYQRRKINVSQVFAGQKVGVKQTDDHIWLVTFMDYDLGYFDDETCRLEPIDNPFGSKLLPMLRNRPRRVGRGDWIRTSDPLRPRRHWTPADSVSSRFAEDFC